MPDTNKNTNEKENEPAGERPDVEEILIPKGPGKGGTREQLLNPFGFQVPGPSFAMPSASPRERATLTTGEDRDVDATWASSLAVAKATCRFRCYAPLMYGAGKKSVSSVAPVPTSRIRWLGVGLVIAARDSATPGARRPVDTTDASGGAWLPEWKTARCSPPRSASILVLVTISCNRNPRFWSGICLKPDNLA